MSPPAPLGSRTAPPTTRLSEATEPSPVPSSTSPAAPAPFRLSLEGSYLLSGQAGSPIRLGVLGHLRAAEFLGVGLGLEGNFSDELTVTGRLEGIAPLHPNFQIEGAALLGLRALFGQEQATVALGGSHLVDGVLFTLGAELGIHLQVLNMLGFSLFGRFLYSPPGSLSARDGRPNVLNPPSGIQMEGYEASVGIRVDLDFGGSRPSSVEAEDSEDPETGTTPQARAHEALRGLEEVVRALAEEESLEDESTQVAPPPTGETAPTPPISRREDLAALQRELEILGNSAEQLGLQIASATRTFDDLHEGVDLLQDLYIRMDRLYYGIENHPPELDRAELENFLGDFTSTLRDSEAFRLVLQSREETIGEGFLRNMRHFSDALNRYRGEGNLETPRSDLSGLISRVESLRSRLIDTQPTTDRINLWRETLESIHVRIERLSPRLEEETRSRLLLQNRRLQENFSALVEEVSNAEQVWLASRTIPDHYDRFTTALRPSAGHPYGNPAQALGALDSLLTELRGAPESIRSTRRRSLENLRSSLNDFVDRRSRHPDRRFAEVRQRAIDILQWMDLHYTAPDLANPPPRRPRTTEGTGSTPPPRRERSSGTETAPRRPRHGHEEEDPASILEVPVGTAGDE